MKDSPSISREIAERTATDFAKQRGYGAYVCCGAEFIEGVAGSKDLPFLTRSPSSWIVRFQRPNEPKGMTVDDGDAMICIEIDAHTGVPSVLEGL